MARKIPVLPQDVTVAKLWKWGYLPEFPTEKQAKENVTHKRYQQAVVDYQRRYELKDDGWVGPYTGSMIARRFCNVPDFAGGDDCKWPHLDVTYRSEIQLRQMSGTAIAGTIDQGIGNINGACALEMTRVTGGANIVGKGATNQSDRQLDGAGGVLAYAYLPCGRVTKTSTLGQVFDQSEPWHPDFLLAVWTHETLHSLGLPHGPRGALMQPTYDERVITPQQWDIAELVKRYGKRTTPAPGPGPVPPSGPTPHVDITVTVGGVKFVAAGNTKPAAAIQAVRKGNGKRGVLS